MNRKRVFIYGANGSMGKDLVEYYTIKGFIVYKYYRNLCLFKDENHNSYTSKNIGKLIICGSPISTRNNILSNVYYDKYISDLMLIINCARKVYFLSTILEDKPDFNINGYLSYTQFFKKIKEDFKCFSTKICFINITNTVSSTDNNKERLVPYLIDCIEKSIVPVINNPDGKVNLIHTYHIFKLINSLEEIDFYEYNLLNEDEIRISDLFYYIKLNKSVTNLFNYKNCYSFFKNNFLVHGYNL